MRIALVISQTKPISSGVARIADRMEIGLRKLGAEVDVYSPLGYPHVYWGEFRLYNYIPLFRKLSQQKPYDIINIHGPVPTFSDILLFISCLKRRDLGGARVAYTHHWDIDISRITAPLAYVYNLGTRLLVRLSDFVIVSSQSYYDDLVRYVPLSMIRIIPWGVDEMFVHPTIPPKNDKFTILYVGQLRPYKGPDILLKACVNLLDCNVIIVGEGHSRDKYIQLVKTLDLNNVTFNGRVSDKDLRDLYAKSHVIVLPSVSKLEAFGIVLLEGMGAGCVPVASNLPGVIDTIGDAGLVFEAGDPTSLGRALALINTNKHLLHLFSHKSWERAKNYSWNKTCQDYFMAFGDLIK